MIISGIGLVAASSSQPFRRHHAICCWKNLNDNHHLLEKSRRSSKGPYQRIVLQHSCADHDAILCCLFSMALRSHELHFETAKMADADHDYGLMCLRKCSGLDEHSC